MNGSGLQTIDENVQFGHYKSGIVNIDFHLHDGCEIYLLLAGDVNYFVEKNIYPLAVGDVIITNAQEVHKPTFASDSTYERMFIQFDPQFVSAFNTDSYDLLHCFVHRAKGEHNRIPLTKVESAELHMLFTRYGRLMQNPPAASNQLKLGCLLEILVLINERFRSQENRTISLGVHEKLSMALDYIDNHLTEDLSLETLERELFINRYYLSKLFKKHIGNTIHEYIVYKRIAMAKYYLSEGYSVFEAKDRAGFADYTSFLKMFKRTVGVLPKAYVGRSRRTNP